MINILTLITWWADWRRRQGALQLSVYYKTSSLDGASNYSIIILYLGLLHTTEGRQLHYINFIKCVRLFEGRALNLAAPRRIKLTINITFLFSVSEILLCGGLPRSIRDTMYTVPEIHWGRRTVHTGQGQELPHIMSYLLQVSHILSCLTCSKLVTYHVLPAPS